MIPFYFPMKTLQQLLPLLSQMTLRGTQASFHLNALKGKKRPLSSTIMDQRSFRAGMKRLSRFVLPIQLAHCVVDAFLELESCLTLAQMYR